MTDDDRQPNLQPDPTSTEEFPAEVPVAPMPRHDVTQEIPRFESGIPAVTPELNAVSAQIISQWEDGRMTYAEAVRQLDILKEAYREHPNDIGQIEYRRGAIEALRGSYNASIQHLEIAREHFMRGGLRARVVACHLNIGETYRRKGNFIRARQYFRIGYEAALELNHREMQVICRINEAQMLLAQGHDQQVETLLLECYELASEPFPADPDRDPDRMERSRLNHLTETTSTLTQLYLQRGDLEQAWRYAYESYLFAGSLHIPKLLGAAWRVMGNVVTRLQAEPMPDMPADPDHYYQQALALFDEVKSESETARTFMAQGSSMAERGLRTRANRKLGQAVALFTQLGMVDDAAKAAEEQLRLL